MRRYDIGAISADVQRWYREPGEPGAELPNASPQAMAALLDGLAGLTEQLEQADRRRVLKGAVDPRAAAFVMDAYDKHLLKDSISVDLWRWRARLDWYIDALDGATDTGEAVLKTVIRPVIFGWHDYDETPTDVISSGYPPGFMWGIRHVSDGATPYIIANMLKTHIEFESEASSLATLWKYIKESAAEVADDVTDGLVSIAIPVGAIALVGLGLIAAWRLTSK